MIRKELPIHASSEEGMNQPNFYLKKRNSSRKEALTRPHYAFGDFATDLGTGRVDQEGQRGSTI